MIYANKIVTTILSIISTRESISKSLISLPSFHKATSVEGLTAYRFRVVPRIILSTDYLMARYLKGNKTVAGNSWVKENVKILEELNYYRK